MTFGKRFLYTLGIFVAFFVLCGCGKAHEDETGSTIAIRIPTDLSPQSKASALSTSMDFDYSRACFAVAVSAPDLPSTPAAGNCDIKLGLFKGYAAPGDTISITIPYGGNRTIELYAYERESTQGACPTLNNLGPTPRNRIFRIAQVPGVHMSQPTTTVDITVASPRPSDSLTTLFSLPQSCVSLPAPAARTAGVTSAHKRISGGRFVIEASASWQQNEKVLTGGPYRVQLSRRPE